ncbi:MAG: Fe-S-containing hydro-lyase [Chloroflexota bacterium]
MVEKAMPLSLPLKEEDVVRLKAGDRVLLTGVLYTARDAAHKRMVEALDRGEKLPVDLKGQVLFYVGPSPARPGSVIGSAGPTTAYRMDRYTPRILQAGLRGTIAKGSRSEKVKEALKQHKAVYLAATGGAGALLSKRILKAEVIAYADLGPEAIRKLEVKDLPAIVINDAHGGDLYLKGREKYRRQG